MKQIIICFLTVMSILFGGCSSNGKEPSSEIEVSSESCASHEDANDDGTCDLCNGSVIVLIDFYTINDLHGKFDDTNEQPGVDELTTYLKDTANFDDYTVIMSSGDMWQGSAESNMTKGQIITDWMNEVGFVSMTIGNHEYDWGNSYIKQNVATANFPFLAINIYDKSTNKRVDYASPSVMVERGGVQIGIIGAIGDCHSSISGEFVEDVYFKTDDDLTELVKAESEKLRKEGADIIVYSLHDGYGKSSSTTTNVTDNKISSYYDIELSDGYVDIVFEGHTHQKYVLRDSKGVYHLQNGGENQGISHAEIKVNSANGNHSVNSAAFIDKSQYRNYKDDPVVDALLEKYKDQIGGAYEVLGNNPSSMSSSQLKHLVAKTYYENGMERWGEKYNIVLGGGYISVRSPYKLPAGQVTYSQLQMLLPFDNRIVLCSIQGKYLSSRFFNTSNSDYYIYYDSYGSTVKSNIDPNATYYIVTDTYCSQYAPNKLTVVEYYDDTTFARDFVADYFRGEGK